MQHARIENAHSLFLIHFLLSEYLIMIFMIILLGSEQKYTLSADIITGHFEFWEMFVIINCEEW